MPRERNRTVLYVEHDTSRHANVFFLSFGILDDSEVCIKDPFRAFNEVLVDISVQVVHEGVFSDGPIEVRSQFITSKPRPSETGL